MYELENLTLPEAVAKLAGRRAWLERRKALVASLEEELAQTRLGQELAAVQQTMESAKSGVQEAEQAVREKAVQVYLDTGETKPHPAITVKKMLKLSYFNDEAIRWSREFLRPAVKLDARLFEKHARAVLETAPLPFVEASHEYQTAISRDLSEWLLKENGDEQP